VYYWYYEQKPGIPYYYNPVGSFLENRMDTVIYSYPRYNDTIRYAAVFDLADSTRPVEYYNPEIDSYKGIITFDASARPALINIPMKRTAFGIKINATNFTSGKLLLDCAGNMASKILTPQEAAAQTFIFSSDDFRFRDSTFTRPAAVDLRWQKPDGSVVFLGGKNLYFKRNVLTTFNVTIPAENTPVSPITTDTTWTGSDNINF
jgi:hypothetical protein